MSREELDFSENLEKSKFPQTTYYLKYFADFAIFKINRLEAKLSEAITALVKEEEKNKSLEITNNQLMKENGKKTEELNQLCLDCADQESELLYLKHKLSVNKKRKK